MIYMVILFEGIKFEHKEHTVVPIYWRNFATDECFNAFGKRVIRMHGQEQFWKSTKVNTWKGNNIVIKELCIVVNYKGKSNKKHF